MTPHNGPGFTATPPGNAAARKADRLDMLFAVAWEGMRDNAQRFTCDEADAIAYAARVAGVDGAEVVEFMSYHIESDEPGDPHNRKATP